MKKRVVAVLLTAVMTASMILTGCGQTEQTGSGNSGETAGTASKEAGETAADSGADQEKVTVKFYGKVIEYTSGPRCV